MGSRILSRENNSQQALLYSFIYIFPLLAVLGFYLGGWYNYLTLIVGYVLVPLSDLVSGTTKVNLNADKEKLANKAAIFSYITYAAGPIIIGIVFWSCSMVSTRELRWYEYLGLILSVALITGGIGITVAHEQCHRVNKMDIFMARLTLLCTCYMHFTIEHVFGHHARVATAEDPATAKLGQSLYRFYFQSVWGGYKSAWNLEMARLKKRRLGFWSLRNQMLWYTVVPLAFMSLIFALFGLAGLMFFVAQAIVGFSYLEVINYIEHYGLERRKTSRGGYEQVKHFHSWNSNHIVSNYLLFGLPRHSDHHAFTTRKYQLLRALDGSPQLPFGYLTMMPIAFIPWLWKRMMDPRVAEARQLLSQVPLLED